jgi:hypothetical protein
VGRRLTDVFALEGRVGYSDIDGWPSWPTVPEKESLEILDIGLDLLSRLNPDGSFSPYLVLGAGYLGTKTASGGEENRPSGSAGLGFEWRLGRTAFAIRGDYRFRLAWEKDNSLTDRVATLGLQYTFGGRSAGSRTSSTSARTPRRELRLTSTDARSSSTATATALWTARTCVPTRRRGPRLTVMAACATRMATA